MKISAGFPPSNPAAEVPAGGNAGDVLTKNSATDYDDSWQPVPITPPINPGGVNTDVQFNDSGNFGGTNDLTFNKTTKILSNAGQISIANGTKTAPSVFFSSDTKTGIYHDALYGNSVLVTCNGTVTIRMSVNTFEFYTIGGNTMFSMFSLAGMMDVPNTGGVRVWSGISALSGTVIAGINRQYSLTQPLTVATLPAAVAALRGARSYVTDSLGPVFGAIVVGGGAIDSPVYCDGTNWRVG